MVDLLRIQESFGPEPVDEDDGTFHGGLVKAEGEACCVDDGCSYRDYAAERGLLNRSRPAGSMQILQIDTAFHHGALSCDQRLSFRCAEDRT